MSLVKAMPLSDDEQRRLDEIEHALRTEDPTFAASIAMDRFRHRRVRWLIAIFVLGVVALLVGLVVTTGSLVVGLAISVIGFLAMVAAVALRFRRRGPDWS